MKNKNSIKIIYLNSEKELNNYIFSLNSYQNLVNQRAKVEKELEKLIDKNTYKIFDNYITIESEIEVLEMQEAFIKGFSVAYQLLIDSLNR